MARDFLRMGKMFLFEQMLRVLIVKSHEQFLFHSNCENMMNSLANARLEVMKLTVVTQVDFVSVVVNV